MTNTSTPVIRFLAAIIDWLLGILLTFLLPLLVLSAANTLPTMFNNLGLLLAISIFGRATFILLQAYLTSSFGGSIGKLICGIQVVGSQGHHLSFPKSLFREYVGSFVASCLLWLGYIWIIVDKKTHRGWNDLVSDSFVTTSNPSGLTTGLVAAVLLLAASAWTLSQTVSQFTLHQSLYQTIVSEITTELNKP